MDRGSWKCFEPLLTAFCSMGTSPLLSKACHPVFFPAAKSSLVLILSKASPLRLRLRKGLSQAFSELYRAFSVASESSCLLSFKPLCNRSHLQQSSWSQCMLLTRQIGKWRRISSRCRFLTNLLAFNPTCQNIKI